MLLMMLMRVRHMNTGGIIASGGRSSGALIGLLFFFDVGLFG